MRTPEQGHTKACLAHAMITVIEICRDNADVTDIDFRINAQENFLYDTDEYFRVGAIKCVCDD